MNSKALVYLGLWQFGEYLAATWHVKINKNVEKQFHLDITLRACKYGWLFY